MVESTATDQSKTYGNVFTFSGTEFMTGLGQLVNGDSIASVTLTSAGAAATAGGPPGLAECARHFFRLAQIARK